MSNAIDRRLLAQKWALNLSDITTVAALTAVTEAIETLLLQWEVDSPVSASEPVQKGVLDAAFTLLIRAEPQEDAALEKLVSDAVALMAAFVRPATEQPDAGVL